MPKDERSPKQPLQSLDHLQTPPPSIMIPHQPSMRRLILIILPDMKLVTHPEEHPILFYLHYAQPRYNSGE